MKKEEPLLRVFVRGGVISPADLLRIMDISAKAGNSCIMFGSRQDILFPAGGTDRDWVRGVLSETELEHHVIDASRLKEPGLPQNIVSSYVAVNIMETTWWLKEDNFHYILEGFESQPVLKVNIIDPIQSLVPLFTGHLNFVASRQEHYWHLFIRKEESNDSPDQWPDLIHGNDIAPVAREIEKILLSSPEIDLPELYSRTDAGLIIHKMEPEEEIVLPTALFPYYEGLNSMRNNLFWLGLYWRNNRFDIDFLRAACHLCQETRVGKISITPWKSFIIKGIRSGDRILWEKLMGKFGLNLRHSSLELNWHLPVLDRDALELKRFLVRELDQQDISTHGLTFTISDSPKMLLFTSVVIEKVPESTGRNTTTYNIRYAREFNPNHSEYLLYAGDVKREQLPDLLIKLSKRYYRELEGMEPEEREPESSMSNPAVSSYQCSRCLTVYDKKYGDPEAGVNPGTPFEELSGDYACPLCSAEKENFEPVPDYG